MGLQVVERDQRLSRRQSQRLGRHKPNHDAADEARPSCDRNRIDLV